MGNTTPNESRSGLVNGVGQDGFVARHGLYTAEQAAAADAVASRIGDLDLRTVRLTVVDQHGVPRSKALSPEVAIAALSNGLDFSGAIYSLATANQVFVPAFTPGGGFSTAPPSRSVLEEGLPVPLGGTAGQHGRHAGDDPRRPVRDRAAAPLDGGRVGSRPGRVQLQPHRRPRGCGCGGAVPHRR